ncbi:MAG: Asp-tRNA(Asn)/Glu-tRNA(Gln) amidotransferase subunit GatC [Candidatus Cardinium sp.]|nr:Asp-tRNA(Asn)/Glu-tRNA(Gln) amidotransferase subunit GatC [Candidatus Cardinium sp.]
MLIDHTLLDKLAYLARLEIRPHERASMLRDLNEVVAWVEQLNELDDILLQQDYNAEVPPPALAQANDLRRDEAAQVLSHEAALALAPDKDANYFRIPAVRT